MKQIRLSENQRKAVDHIEGALLVKASAGSGKTRVLTERIKKLLAHTQRKILAITFTNKAGKEMQDRLQDVVGLRDRAYIGTIHGFCQQIVEQRALMLGYKDVPTIFENERDRQTLMEQAIMDTPSYRIEYNRFDDKCKLQTIRLALDVVSKIKRSLLRSNELSSSVENENLILLYNSYQDILKSQNAIDFDDLILLAYQLLIDFPNVARLYRNEYEYICIDEAQDLNEAQYRFIRALTGETHKNVMMVGDPNQSIFAFTGSSPEYMTIRFIEDYNAKTILLNENYRSSKEVIKAAQSIIPNSVNIENLAINGRFELIPYDNEDIEAKCVVGIIKSLLNTRNFQDIEDDVTEESICVLARNKYLLYPIEKKLTEQGLSFYYKTTPGPPQFESDELKVLNLALMVKINPQDSHHLKQICEILKCSPHDYKNNLDSIQAPESLIDILRIARDLSDDGRELVAQLDKYKDKLREYSHNKDDNYALIVQNELYEMKQHWRNYKRNTDNPTIKSFRANMALGKTNSFSEEIGITLSTVHTMKGQEKDIVFIIGMDDGTFPDYRAIKSGGLELQQEKNNAYVAFTRAKRFLYVSYPQIRTMPWGNHKRCHLSRHLTGLISS